MKCLLSPDVNTCPYFISKETECVNYNKCSFQENPNDKVENKQPKYIRKERWYEKYYKRK